MTMTTRVHIADPVDAEGLFLHLLGVLEADPSFTPSWLRPEDELSPFRSTPGPLSLGRATYEHVRRGDVMYHRHDNGEPVLWEQSKYRSTLGQGLAAILEVAYAEDAPLVWPPYEWDEDGDEPRDDPLRVHLVSVDFDTAYGYKDPNGAHCGDLHAFLVREVGRWIDAQPRPAKWLWRHEEAGSWHSPDELALRGDADLSVLNTVSPFASPCPAQAGTPADTRPAERVSANHAEEER